MSQKSIFKFNETPVAYYTTGKGKPLLILHGWGSNSRVMWPLAQNLSHIRTCYLIDLPGFGESPAPSAAWDIDHYADLIAAFIKENELGRVDILAHSFGGRITLKLSARSNADTFIDKILITGGAGMTPKRSMKYHFKKYFAKSLKAPFLILPGKFRESALSHLRKTSLWKSLGSTDYQALEGVMREIFVKTVTEFLEDSLPAISNEVLLLWGRNDDTTPLYQAQRMEHGLKNAALVTIDNAGHYAFLDQPNKFKIIAEAFFKDESS